MVATPDYPNPPIVELAISAQFSPLTKLSAGHFGFFWHELGSDWTDPGDAPPIEDQYELFDRPRSPGLRLRLRPIRLPLRFTLGHKCKVTGQRFVRLASWADNLYLRCKGLMPGIARACHESKVCGSRASIPSRSATCERYNAARAQSAAKGELPCRFTTGLESMRASFLLPKLPFGNVFPRNSCFAPAKARNRSFEPSVPKQEPSDILGL
jgi:hypothetical protein